ncbi:MAG TPA: MBL fold metallo-hydrolase, partial [Edaphobacter sp.]
YFIDVEGGQATLFVTPAEQSLLIDTEPSDSEGHNAERIAEAVKDSGMKKIDYALVSHLHEERSGGALQLLDRVPIGALIDSASAEEDEDEHEPVALSRIRHIRVNPGDVLPIVGMKAIIINANGRSIAGPLDGSSTPNPLCQKSGSGPQETAENTASLGVQITFGKLKIIDTAELSTNRERELLCPVNKLGRADLYVVSHREWEHGPAMLNTLGARVAILDGDTPREGSHTEVDVPQRAAGLETLWQLHPSEEGTDEHDSSGEYVANLEGPEQSHFLKLVSTGDGSFDIYNSRTRVTKHYGAMSAGSER